MSRSKNNMGSIRRRPDGRWEGRYSAPDGRQRSVYGKTQKECAQKLRAALADVDSGSWLQPSKMTVGAWLDTWIADYCGHATDSTREYYKKLARLYIKPALGDVRLASLSPVHVRRMLSGLHGTRCHDLSAKTLRSVLGALTAALNAALQARLIRENPAADVPVPRSPKPEMHIIDRPQIPAFIAAAQSTPHPDALVLLLQTGLRSGELRGLRWEDVDWDQSVLRVRRQLHTGKGGAVVITPPKEGRIRDIVVGPEVLALLRRHKRHQAAEKLEAGSKWIDTPDVKDLVFRMSDGRQLHDRALLNAVYRVARAINMPGLHPHDLRHSYAVAALRSGVDAKTVQHNLGHASAAMTLDIYAAYTTDAARIGAEKLSAYWRDATN